MLTKMFSLVPKIKIHPGNIRADSARNIFTASVKLTEYKIQPQNGLLSKLKALFDKPSEYEFSNTNLLHKNNMTRQFCTWPDNSTPIKIKSIARRALATSQLDNAPHYTSKRNASGPRAPNPNPPNQGPNMPKSDVKNESTENNKIKKSTVDAKDKITKSQADKQTANEIKKILRHRWGVKLVKDVVPPKSDTAVPVSATESMIKLKSDDRVLLGIVNKTDAELDNSHIKRNKGSGHTMDKIVVLQTMEHNETTAKDAEYYVPEEVKGGEVVNMWKNAVAKSTRRATEKGPSPEELHVAESIFIRPEPPVVKPDEK